MNNKVTTECRKMSQASGDFNPAVQANAKGATQWGSGITAYMLEQQ